MLPEVIYVSDKASVTQANFLILCSIKVGVNSLSRGCPPPKVPSASATVCRSMALSARSLLELHTVRALPACAPASANAQILLPWCGVALRGRLRPTPAAESAWAPRRERGRFPGGPGAPPAAGASPGSGTAPAESVPGASGCGSGREAAVGAGRAGRDPPCESPR